MLTIGAGRIWDQKGMKTVYRAEWKPSIPPRHSKIKTLTFEMQRNMQEENTIIDFFLQVFHCYKSLPTSKHSNARPQEPNAKIMHSEMIDLPKSTPHSAYC